MANLLYSLPRPVWTFTIAVFLSPTDLLLRTVDKSSQAFVNSLLPELISALEAQSQTELADLEPVRLNILSMNELYEDVKSLLMLGNPADPIVQVHNVINCLYTRRLKSQAWDESAKFLRTEKFTYKLKEKLRNATFQEVHTNPDCTRWLDLAIKLHDSSTRLLEITQSYVLLQQSYQQSHVLRAWLHLLGKVKAVERVKGCM